MIKHKNRYFALLVSVLMIFSLFGCSSRNEETVSTDSTLQTDESEKKPGESLSDHISSEKIAQNFATEWSNKWTQLQEEGIISNGIGYAFLADMDNDDHDELIFLYDYDISYEATIYRINNNDIQEMGSFTVSHTDPVLSFTIYEAPGGAILKNISVRSHEMDSSETEESYITMESNKVLQEILFCTSYDGSDTYYDSVLAGAKEISLDEFNKMREEILSDAKELYTIFLEPENSVDCTDADAVTSYIQNLLENGNKTA